jgi:membrane protein
VSAPEAAGESARATEAGWRTLRRRCYAIFPIRVAYRAWLGYNDHRCIYMGAALSFFAALSVIPLVYTAVVVLARVLGSTEAAQTQLRVILEQYLLPPVAANAIMERVQALLNQGWIWGSGAWWSLALVLWSGVRFYESLQSMFAAAWGWKPMRPFLYRQGISTAAFIIASLLLGLAIVLSVSVTTFSHANQSIAGLDVSTAGLMLFNSLPMVLAIAVFFMIYKFIPPVDVPWRLALWLGIGASISWDILRRVFLIVVGTSGLYQDIYGPLSSLMLLLLWVYSTSALMLFGAEVGAAYQHEVLERDRLRQEPALPGLAPPLNPEERPLGVS